MISNELKIRIEELLAAHRVVLFMKGSPDTPRCGFSGHAVEMLGMLGTGYHSIDILADEELRQGMKEYADWPTYPQLWVQGELVGGHDIMAEMFDSGELKTALEKAA